MSVFLPGRAWGSGFDAIFGSPIFHIMKYRQGNQIPIRQLEERCVQLANQGLNSTEIGKQLGITPTRASKARNRALAKLTALSDYEAETLRRIELSRLDEMHNAIYGQAIGSETRMISIDGKDVPVRMTSLEAIDRILKIQKQRMSYVPGLEIPKESESQNRSPVQISVNYVRQGVDGKALDAPPTIIISQEQCQPEQIESPSHPE